MDLKRRHGGVPPTGHIPGYIGGMPDAAPPPRWVATAGLIGGLAVFLLFMILPPPSSLPPAGWRTAAVGAAMAVWWMTEAVPLPATALVPLVAFPLLGVAGIDDAAAPYANPVIFLFLGGFVIAAALEECGLHRRAALAIVRISGTSPRALVGGFMIATAAISMWVSNTATAAMMLPMALAISAWHDERGGAGGFSPALLLGIAYAASIGGVGTLIGTPPNALLAGFMAESYGVQLGFLEWMTFGVPLVVIGLPIAWLVLTRVVFHVPGGGLARSTDDQVLGAKMGTTTGVEWLVGTVTALTAAAWLLRPLLERRVPGVSDAGIAVAGALALLVIPVDRSWRRPISWARVERLPWGTLILFGGGLALADAIQSSGLAAWLGESMRSLDRWPVPLIVVAIAAAVILLSELASNTSMAAVFLPVVGSLAVSLGAPPLVFALAAAVGASTAFMLPVGTPPNAIVYGTGRITMPQMVRAGLLLDIAFIGLVAAAVLWLAPLVFG